MVPWRSYNGGTGLQRTGSLVSLRNKRLKPSLSSRATMAEPGFNGLRAPKSKRDTYGFALRSQHVQRYREYFNIYKEEEEERSNKWKYFLENVEKSSQSCSPENSDKEELQAEATEQKEKTVSESGEEGNDTISKKTASDLSSDRDPEKELKLSEQTETSEVQTWTLIRSSLSSVENMMSIRVRKGRNMQDEQIIVDKDHLPFIEEATSSGMASEDDCEDKICLDDAFNESKNAFSAENSVSDGHSDGEKVARTGEAVDVGTEEARVNGAPSRALLSLETRTRVSCSWRSAKGSQGRGVKARRVEKYYYDLLAQEINTSESMDNDNSSGVPRKWRRQIEKDIPRTFPGHPALNENGWNSLRRLLLAYAHHNPSVGYCQIEQLDQEVAELRQALADKTEQETAMLKVLMWMEQEQKVTEDAQLRAEQEAAAQKSAVNVLQEKYDKSMSSRTEMEKRVKVAESMLEATLQYESGQAKALSPRDPVT